MEEMLITLPWPEAARSSAAACTRMNGAVRLTSSARRQVSGDCRSNGTAQPSRPLVPTNAALLTMISMRPNFSRTCRGNALTAAGCSKSQANAAAFTGKFASSPAAAASAPGAAISAIAILAPSSARPFATARPIWPAPPVTSATRPSSDIISRSERSALTGRTSGIRRTRAAGRRDGRRRSSIP